MAEPDVHVNRDTVPVNGPLSLESRLRHLFAEQRRLRELLEQTAAERDRVNREVLRTQEEYCTSPEREEEYGQCLKRLLGFDPREDVEALEEARKNPLSLDDLLAELERIGKG